MRGLASTVIAFVLALGTLDSSAGAQDKSRVPDRALAQQPPRRGRKVIRIAETRIEGRIQKPQAFYILQRSSLNFEGLELKQSFIPKILKSVEGGPF